MPDIYIYKGDFRYLMAIAGFDWIRCCMQRGSRLGDISIGNVIRNLGRNSAQKAQRIPHRRMQRKMWGPVAPYMVQVVF